ncbi:unnamed protein product [Staurois parvus]|uniref:Uncharacterized protein n=1 Tax=Staurois parvus TaxID=386267 RepID=A0ABN9AQS4_9NEOB|nr:unnamed protein product [Staurois parvus]
MVTSLKLPGNITYQTVYLCCLEPMKLRNMYPVTMAAYKDSTFTRSYQNEEEVTNWNNDLCGNICDRS